jgi:hypothetical protein
LPAWLERQQAPATSPGDRRLRREQNILRLQRERQRFLSFSKSV